MPKIIALFNQAGGTGKTTLAMNLGYALAQRGHNVLLIDMDPQSSLTVFMGLQPYALEGTISESVLEQSPLPFLREIHQMDLVPSNLTLSAADVRLAIAIAKETRLKKSLAPVEQNYNFVLIDCPLTLGCLAFFR